MPDDISNKVRKIVADHLGIEETKVTEESSFIDDLGADSLDTVELVMAFEEEFGSEISDNEAEKILTVGDAIKFIESKNNKFKANVFNRRWYYSYIIISIRSGQNNIDQKACKK